MFEEPIIILNVRYLHLEFFVSKFDHPLFARYDCQMLKLMDGYKSLSDSELAERLNRKDPAALEHIYLRYWAGLFNYASRLLRDEATAEDLVHDLFVYLLINQATLNIQTPLDSYLYRAVKNRVIDRYRADSNRKKYIESLRHFIEEGRFATDEAVLEKEMKNRINEAMAALPDKMREVVRLTRMDEMTRKEVALATSVSEETVKTQMKRAMKILRTKLTALFF